MKKLLYFFFILLISSNVVFSNEITDDYVDIAKNLMNENNIIDAKKYVDLVLILEPDNERAFALKNIINSNEQTFIVADTPVTIEEFPLNSNIEDVEIAKGIIYFNEENYEKAIKSFKRAKKENREISYYNIALSYKMLGNCSKTEKYLNKIFENNLQSEDALLLSATMYRGSERLDRLKSVLEVSPANYKALFYTAEYNKNIGAYQVAEEYYKKAIDSESKLAAAYLGLGQCYFETGNFDDAIQNFQKYLTFIPDDDEVSFLLAKAYEKIGLTAETKKILMGMQSLGSERNYLFELAKVNYFEQNYQIATYILKRIIREEKSPLYYNLLGLCYYQSENMNDALIYFSKALELDKTSPAIYYNMASCYSVTGDKELAKQYIDVASAIIPTDAKSYADKTIMYLKLSKYDMALETVNEGISKFEDDKNLYIIKLKICKVLGNMNEYEKTKNVLYSRFGTK